MAAKKKTTKAPAKKKVAKAVKAPLKASTLAEPARNAPAEDWLVYADALQEKGDLRGTLITLDESVRAGKTKPTKRDEFIEKNADVLIGKGAEPFLKNDAYRFQWRWGAIESADVVFKARPGSKNSGPAKLDFAPLKALLAAPSLARADSLSLVGVVQNGEQILNLAPAIALLLKNPDKVPATLSLIDERAGKCRRLLSRDWEPPDNLIQLGSLDDLCSLPRLTSLSIVTANPNNIDLTVIEAPNLRSFSLRGLVPPGEDIVGACEEADWPNLESFELRLPEQWMANAPNDDGAYNHYMGPDDTLPDLLDEAAEEKAAAEKESAAASGGGDDDDDEDGDGDWGEESEESEGMDWSEHLTALLTKLKKLPRLKRLALTGFYSSESVVTMLLKVGLPPKLEELDLSDSGFDNDDAKAMLKGKAKLSQLKRLVLLRTKLSIKDAKGLSKLGPEIVHSHSAIEARYRYVVGAE